MWFIILLQLLIIIVLVFYIHDLIAFEQFVDGYGTTFGMFYNPIPPCTNETNCFKGFQSRGSIYTNMCEPIPLNIPGLGLHINYDSSIDTYKEPYYGKLLRTKRPLQEECIKLY
tara:strand:- start:233 stop:574 length:342 start_codon:yes stop_codon:yes gene_type:complete